jgi:hypothetical protein
MAGHCAEMETTVGRRGEVTAVAAFAVEANEPAAVRAPAYPVPEVGVVHGFKVGGASCVPPDPSRSWHRKPAQRLAARYGVTLLPAGATIGGGDVRTPRRTDSSPQGESRCNSLQSRSPRLQDFRV